jgi:hypothetical protein
MRFTATEARPVGGGDAEDHNKPACGQTGRVGWYALHDAGLRTGGRVTGANSNSGLPQL